MKTITCDMCGKDLWDGYYYNMRFENYLYGEKAVVSSVFGSSKTVTVAKPKEQNDFCFECKGMIEDFILSYKSNTYDATDAKNT